MTDKRHHWRSTRARVGRLSLLALVPALALATACGGDDSSSSSTDDAPETTLPDNAATGSPIRIGLLSPEGGAAISLPGNREAAEAVVAYANANLGGIGGHRVELVTCATKEDPASNRDCANRMVEERVTAVVVTASAFGDTMVPVIVGAGIPYVVANASSAAEMTTPGAYSLTGGYPGVLQGMATYAAERGHKKTTIFVLDSPATVVTANSMGKAAFSAKGIELNVVPIPAGTPDATPQVSSGIGSDVGAVAIAADPTLCTSVLKALDTLGAGQDKMLVQPCSDPSTVEAVGDALDGAQVFSTSDLTSDDPEAVLYRTVMKQYAPNTELSGLTYAGYQSTLGLVRAAQGVTGEPTAAAVSAALTSARNVPLPVGHGITFSCDSSVPQLPALCSTDMVRVTLRDGVATDPQVTK
ncbi:ABC transporter substrate-binding protein [Nocardia harenae]|uniref:ABC transporter substrate-binding protein n=1 Tax=Nocardia harenae TaxID=358707 RepID=UPI000835FC31|nr:ABC transporter substrate-binding protein [Nocardia harenae]